MLHWYSVSLHCWWIRIKFREQYSNPKNRSSD